jgi:hypothetical protein
VVPVEERQTMWIVAIVAVVAIVAMVFFVSSSSPPFDAQVTRNTGGMAFSGGYGCGNGEVCITECGWFGLSCERVCYEGRKYHQLCEEQ